MTLTSSPNDPANLYASMGTEGLRDHLRQIIAQLERAGVELTPATRLGLDELDECITEHHARSNPAAFQRDLARATGKGLN